MARDRKGAKVVDLTRTIVPVDRVKISRYTRMPELGPRVLFFTGGTALNAFSQRLKRYTHNSIHLVTPFDSGGSSAVLRKAFSMPAVGDLRHRLMALADESALGHPEVFSLFAHRLGQQDSQSELRAIVEKMRDGKHHHIKFVPEPIRSLISDYLGYFLEAAPNDFDFRKASIGNLILTGGYLRHNRSLDPIAFLFSKLVNVRGTVRTITDENTQLRVETEDGSVFVGQHLIGGKETKPVHSKITRIELVAENTDPRSRLPRQRRRLIRSAELIVFPPGSFYSSVIANLLPKGVGRAIMQNPVQRIYIPNLGEDPEQFGMTLQEQITKLDETIRRDAGITAERLCLDLILTDSRLLPGIDDDFVVWLNSRGAQLMDVDLESKDLEHQYDETKLCEAILSLF